MCFLEPLNYGVNLVGIKNDNGFPITVILTLDANVVIIRHTVTASIFFSIGYSLISCQYLIISSNKRFYLFLTYSFCHFMQFLDVFRQISERLVHTPPLYPRPRAHNSLFALDNFIWGIRPKGTSKRDLREIIFCPEGVWPPGPGRG